MLTIVIETDNAAFADSTAGREVARILRKLADQVEDWPGVNTFSIGLRDLNGNTVGKADFT
jgi:hypothetical protein